MDVYIQLTKDCNHDCIFCSAPKKEVYLPYEEVISRIDRFQKQGVGSSNSSEFVLTGGEPTLHPDLIKIFNYLKNKNLCFRMITNGVNLKDYDFVKKLHDAGLRRVFVSVHHYDLEQAKYISSADTLDLKDTLKGLENVNSFSDIDICINTTIIKQNYKSLLKIAKSLVSKFENIRSYSFNYVDVCGNVLTNDNSASSIVPKYSECEKYLYDVFRYLIKNGIIFRFERSPLCYSRGFEHHSSDANRNVGAEFYTTTFTEKTQKEVNYNMYGFVKSEACKSCNLNSLCSGVSSRYSEIYGVDELYPVFDDPLEVEYKIKLQNNYRERIFLGRALTYDFDELNSTLEDAFSKLEGFTRYMKSRATILIKPNLLGNNPLSCTNLNLLKVLIGLLKKNNNTVIVADGPGGHSVEEAEKVFTSIGLRDMCDELGVRCVNLLDYGYHVVPINNGSKVRSMEVSNIVDEVDYILNVPKLKTHGLTFLTGAIKNMFGLVSPKSRKEIHKFEDRLDFSTALVDVYSYFKSKISLTVLDAIHSMQGQEGPLHGSKYESNFFLIARDGLSIDVLASYLTMHNISSILTSRVAASRNLGFLDLDRLEIIGGNIEDFMCKDFEKSLLFSNNELVQSGEKYKSVPLNKNCITCRNCILSCPTSALYFEDGKIKIDSELCIGCFTCKELCPVNDFDMKKVV